MKALTLSRMAAARLRANKRAYVSLLIGIFLSVFLVTTLVLCIQGVILAQMERNNKRLGYEDAFLLDTPELTDGDLAEMGYFDTIGHVYVSAGIQDTNIYLGWYDETGADLLGRQVLEGRLPEKAGEIAMERSAMLAIREDGQWQLGEEVTLDSLREELTLLPKGCGQPTVVFTGDDAETALARAELPPQVTVICQTARVPETLRPELRFFDRAELCAAMYWQRQPLRNREQRVMLVGFGHLGRELLEQALLTNIFSPVRVTQYHVFGNGTEFLLDHPQLGASVSLGMPDETRDSVIFHDRPWNEDQTLLLSADRIILCADDERENTVLCRRMKTWFPISARVDLYSRCAQQDSALVFGTDSEIFTPEAVLRSGLERMARQINENYRAACGGNAPTWEELSAFLRRSNMASANHLRTKLRFLLDDDSLTEFTPDQMRRAYDRFLELRESSPDLCRRIEHDRWVRFHAMYNWRYAPQRDNAQRLHPLMVPFDELTLADQAKDDYAWELISSLL